MKIPSCCTGLCMQIAAAHGETKILCPTSIFNFSEDAVCVRCDRAYKEIVNQDYTLNPSYPKDDLSKTGSSS